MVTSRSNVKKLFMLFFLVIGVFFLGSCDSSEERASDVASASNLSFDAGSYDGESEGHNGIIRVNVEVSETDILDIEITENNETESIAEKALNDIPKEILENQSLSVDTISGATVSSNAIIEAVKSALLAAGASEEDLDAQLDSEDQTEMTIEELETDVVIIGAGGAGTAAAVTAAENGARVIVLEKTAIPGGTTANGGGFFAADSRQAQSIGHEPLDTTMVFNAYMEEMDWKVDANLVRQFLELSGNTANWLEDHGVEFHKMDEAVQQSHAEGTNGYHKYDDFTKTSEQLGAMLQMISDEYGAQLFYETPATELISQDNEVTGVIAQGKGNVEYHISAKSVVIATGGFVGNEDMVRDALNGTSVNASGYNSNVGDGINMAGELGASLRGMEAMVLHTFTIEGSENVTTEDENDPMTATYATSSLAYMPVIPWLNPQGFRFANEDIIYDRALSTNSLVSQGNYGWFIYNEDLLRTLEEEGAAASGMTDTIAMGPIPELTPLQTGWTKLTESVDQMVASGDVKKADSLEDLAEETGMDSATLRSTMESYNAAAQNGSDDQFGKREEHLYDLSSGPYYAFKVTANNLSTVGGLRINPNFQVVLNDETEGYIPIANLYAAGSDAGGIYSDHYAHTIEGAAQGWAYNSGRLSGAKAVENALEITIDLLNE